MTQAAAAADLARQIAGAGYAVLPGRLDAAGLAAARAGLAPLLESAAFGSGFEGAATKRVQAALAVTRCLDAAALDPLVLDVVGQVTGPGAQFGMTSAVQVHPGQGAQPLHCEQGVYPLPRDHDVMVTAIWALEDFTAGNGATRVVPGSHLRDPRPGPEQSVPVQMAAGSVLLIAGRLYHGAGANVTARPRLGAVIDYVQPWLRPCEAHALAADLAEVRALPQRLQELLGFNQPSPYLGFIGGMHPRDWLLRG